MQKTLLLLAKNVIAREKSRCHASCWRRRPSSRPVPWFSSIRSYLPGCLPAWLIAGNTLPVKFSNATTTCYTDTIAAWLMHYHHWLCDWLAVWRTDTPSRLTHTLWVISPFCFSIYFALFLQQFITVYVCSYCRLFNILLKVFFNFA